MDRLEALRQKLDKLIRRFNETSAALQAKEKALKEREEETVMLRSQLEKAEARVLALEIGAAIPDAESRAASRRQLDAVIGEIDKILRSIND